MSTTAFDHPFLSKLIGDPEIAGLLSAQSDIAQMLAYEAALARALAGAGVIPRGSVGEIERLCGRFSPDMDALAIGVERDGVVVADLVAQMRKDLPEFARADFHFGATSQDVIDTSLILRIKAILAILDARISGLIGTLQSLEGRFGDNALKGRTRMQDAVAITARDRLTDWRLPLERARVRLKELSPRLLVVQFGGAAGTLDKLGDKAPAVVAALASDLGLGAPVKSWHNQRDTIAEFAGWLAQVSGSLGKIGQDVAIMAQNPVGEIALSGGGGSSAMPHKSNPVAAEVLVSFARHNAALSSSIVGAMVHENERSGAAWTLEWMTLPQMMMTTGASTLQATRLLASIERIG